MDSVLIRAAKKSDAEEISRIYGFYAENSTATFSEKAENAEFWRKKIARTKKIYPFFVAESAGGKISGFVYASEFRPHDAYRWNAESTIYLAPHAPKRCGIGSALYEKFLSALKIQGFKFVHAVITEGNEASASFHEKFGFEKTAEFPEIGCKGGKWLGIVWMTKKLGETDENPREITEFRFLKGKI